MSCWGHGTIKGIPGIFCVRLLRKRTTFPDPIFKSRTIFGKDFPSRFQILTQNLKFSTFRVCKSRKTVLFRELIFMCGYWGSAPPSQIWFSKVGPFSETIFQADFRSWLEIWNFQLLGCVNPEKLSFLESWLFVCGYWGSTPPSQVWFSKVGPLLDLARSGQNFEMPRSQLSWLRGCVSPEKLSFLEG